MFRTPAILLGVVLCCSLAGCGSEDGSSGTGTAQDSSAADASGADSAGGSDTTAADTGGSADTGSSIACHPIKNSGKNTGCPEGQHCVYEGNLITCTTSGEHGLGEDCEDGKGCTVGICVKGQTGKSRCANFCTSDLHCSSQSCNQLQDSKGKVCDMGGDELTPCDPLAQDCKQAGTGCYGTPKGFGCLPAGSVAAGDPCDDYAACVAGYACVGLSSGQDGYCRKICRQGGGAPACDGVTEGCSKLFGSATAGYCGG